MVLISGVLKGPYGDSRSGVTITMRSMKTSSTVLNLAKSQSVTDDTGRYSLNVEPGAYEIIVSVYGAQPERVGTIEVYVDSLPGTLNDFLRRPGEDDITPEIVQTVDRLRAEAALSADKSAASAVAAKVSEQNANESSKAGINAGFASGPVHTADIFSTDNKSCIRRYTTATANRPGGAAGGVMVLPVDGGPSSTYFALSVTNQAWVGNSTIAAPAKVVWSSLWTSTNTTVDANGFIKKASPIVKLFRDGTCELNDESQGVTTERVSEGIYRVSGTLGFNADAQWGGPDGGIEVPLDRNKQPLIWVDYEVEPTGDLLIKTYHRTYPGAPAFARNDVLGYDEGMPIDIPEGRWVDLRVEMPVREVEEAPEAVEETAALENVNVDPI
ncbi:TPA: prophage tail fiber N-terminal domain-containing protein [Serratia marcescens]